MPMSIRKTVNHYAVLMAFDALNDPLKDTPDRAKSQAVAVPADAEVKMTSGAAQ